jgi:hypothetical protein
MLIAAQLLGFCLLLPRDRKRTFEVGFGFYLVPIWSHQCDFGDALVNVGLAPLFFGCFDRT